MNSIKIFALFSLWFLSGSITSSASSTPDKVPLGKVAEVSGSAWIVQGSKRTPAQSGSTLSTGDVLVTEGDSQVKLVVGAKEAALLLKKDSQLNIKKTSPNSWMIDLDHGMLLSHVKPNPTSLKSHFHVRTPTAVMGVRGTTFFVKMEPQKDLFLCTCSGMVSVDDKVLILGKNHDSPKLIQAGAQPISKRLQPSKKGEDHSDVEAVALAKLID